MINLLPGGNLLGGQIGRVSKVYDHNWRAEDVVQETWDGQGEWRFDKADEIDLGDGPMWSARQNHDLVRKGCPVGYYVPGMRPIAEGGRTLMLSYRSGNWPEVTRNYLARATRMIEGTSDGEIRGIGCRPRISINSAFRGGAERDNTPMSRHPWRFPEHLLLRWAEQVVP